MSKTYKTNPYWVKVNKAKTSKLVKEYHDHRNNPCDLDMYSGGPRCFWWQRREQKCGYDVSYYGYRGGFYSRPRRGKEISNIMEGSMRAGWRKAKHDLLKLDRDAVEDYDVKSYQHRHSALWEMY